MNASAHPVTLFDVGSHALRGSRSESCHVIHVHVRLSLSSPLSSTLICSSPSSPFFFPLMHFEQHTEHDNLIAMQNLLTSANKGSNDACDVHTSQVMSPTSRPSASSTTLQIRTLLDEQRQMIIAEYCEKIGQHELQAVHAEEERRILREEFWRQQMDFRVVHQQSLTEMEELRKFQSSTFDTLVRRKLIEDQNTIMELSGRLPELQNEVNCMNDSKDFQDAESVRSGNSHVTSQPVSFPPHPIPEGLLRHSFVSPCRREGPPSIWDTHGISGNVFANPHASSESMGDNH